MRDEFVLIYVTKSILSVISDKTTGKCKYTNLEFYSVNLLKYNPMNNIGYMNIKIIETCKKYQYPLAVNRFQ